MAGDGLPFDWVTLVPRLVHPLKVAIIEALLWIDAPMSASELNRVFAGRFGVNLVSYHVKSLAEVGVVVKVRDRQVRGVLETFYFFPAQQ
ncbi:MAG: helix-turn-helix domain-containing protein [Solirubrobacterales bacterium]